VVREESKNFVLGITGERAKKGDSMGIALPLTICVSNFNYHSCINLESSEVHRFYFTASKYEYIY
jgi:hypothetical protein